MGPRLLFSILLITILATFATAQITPNYGPPISWRSYSDGKFSKVTQPMTRVINNEIEWSKYWTETGGSGRLPKDIKWNDEFLLAAHLGTRPTMGYSVMVEKIERIGPRDIRVTYVEKTPAGPAAQAQSSPFEIVRINRTSGRFVYEKKTRIDTDSVSVGIKWRTYETDTNSNIRESLQIVLKSQSDLNSYWRRLSGESAPDDVDWNTEILVAIHVGQKRTTGYNVLVESVEPLLDGSLAVCYLEQVPSEGQRVRRDSISPYVIIRLPRTDAHIRFRGRFWNSGG